MLNSTPFLPSLFLYILDIPYDFVLKYPFYTTIGKVHMHQIE